MEAGFEATHWSEIGSNEAPDTKIIDYAKPNDF
jgi:predicted nuclease of predicted toxin-antitoxin system